MFNINFNKYLNFSNIFLSSTFYFVYIHIISTLLFEHTIFKQMTGFSVRYMFTHVDLIEYYV